LFLIFCYSIFPFIFSSFPSWSIVRFLGPDVYALLTVVGIRRGWIELMLITITLMNAFAYYSSGSQPTNPPTEPASSGRRKSGGLGFASPTHRRLQGLTPRQRPKSFGSPSLSSSAYPSTPLSSVNYRVASPLSQSFTNLSMSSPGSSPLAGYGPRGRHSMGGRSHPLDTSLLDRLMADDSDGEDEE